MKVESVASIGTRRARPTRVTYSLAHVGRQLKIEVRGVTFTVPDWRKLTELPFPKEYQVLLCSLTAEEFTELHHLCTNLESTRKGEIPW